MRIALIKNGKIYHTDLPKKVFGSFWIEDKDKNNLNRNLINIEPKDGIWYIKSNYEAKIIKNGIAYDEIALKNFSVFELQVRGEKNNYLICTTPVYDENSYEFDTGINCDIYIGNDSQNTINYKNPYIDSKQCLITCRNGKWHIKNLTTRGVVFVNGILTNDSDLEVGDTIFIVNLKIAICGTYIIMNKPDGIASYNSNILKEKVNVNSEEPSFQNIIADEEEISVYEKNEYFFRMPRFRTLVEEEEINIDPPPEQAKQDEIPLAYTLGPMITMGITSMVSGITSISNVAGGQQTLVSALPSLITCLAMLLSMIFWPMLQKKYTMKQAQKKEKIRIEKYNEYIEERKKYIRDVVTKQKQSLIENNVPLDECEKIIVNRKRNLWERKINHDDFLSLRLGIGNVEPFVKVKYPEAHFSIIENNLKSVLDKLGEETKVMENVPVSFKLTEKNISAIVGIKILTKSFIEGILLQLMTFHSYEDLKIVIMTSKENEHKWNFLKSSPYCSSNDRSIRFFSTNIDEANHVSAYLCNCMNERKYEDGDSTKLKTQDYKSYAPYYVIITDDYQTLRNIEIIKEALNQNINLGFSLLIEQERLLGLPNECTTFINIDAKDSIIFQNELTKDKQQTFKADFIGNIDIKKINKLVDNIPIEMDNDRYALPEKLGFLEMFNVGKVEQLNPLNRWKNNNPINSLSAPVGVDTNGELFKLDLHEKFHGPHGLIAGMTGSGKSAFIITYILSMAINYHPEEVSFVLIDYKGGGLAGAFENEETGVRIPHLAGTITNLDVNDMKRSLASIQSELKRRQTIFNDARQKLNESTIDIYKYQKLRREGKVEIAVPHLFIISDEFAELKTQQPEFMEQLISAARIGRSLGIHLILATQKPSGIVDDQIWSNTKFRICLKVQDKSDSVDMIKCQDAAALHNVGRFYLQVGYNEFFALGQSAYAGVPYFNTDKIKRKIDTNIVFIDNVGNTVKSVNKEDENENKKFQGEELSNIVNFLYNLGKQQNVFAKQLWLDKIPKDIYIDDLEKKYNYSARRCIMDPVIGEYDDPSTQSQHLLKLPLSEEGNTIIYGAASMGKEDLISSIIYSIIMKHTPDEVNFYIVDCGSETLKMYEDAPHVGDVLLSTDIEKINNLFKMLKDEIEKRKKIFAEFGGNYDLYIKNSGKIIPSIIVIINLYEAFDEMYPDYADQFNSLTREGLKYGIVFIITTNGVNFIRYKLRQNFKQNLVLQLNDENDYSDVIGNTHGLYPSKIKGRGLIKFKEIYEFQSAKFKTNGNNVAYVKQLCIKLKEFYRNSAKPVPILPPVVNFESVKNYINGLDSVPIGIEKNTLEVSKIDLRSNPVTVVSALENLSFESFVPEFIKVCSFNKNVSINVIDAEKIFESEKFNCNYYKEDIEGIFNKVFNYIEKLYKTYVDNNYTVQSLSSAQDLLVVIVGLSQFKQKLSPESQDKLEDFMTKLKDLRKVSIVIFDTVDNIKQFEYDLWYKKVVLNNRGVWIGDGISDQYTIKLSKTPKYIKEEIGNEYGYNVKKGNPVLIKMLSNTIIEGDSNNE